MTGKLSEISRDERVPEASFDGDAVSRLAEERVNDHLLSGGMPFRVVTDSRGDVGGAIFVGLPGEKHDGSQYAEEALDRQVAGVVVGREFWGTVKDKARRMGKAAICVADPLFFFGELAREKRGKIKGTVFVGITGSTGKTTTKDMVSAVLGRAGWTFKNPGNYNNLVGLPLSLMMMREEDEYGVLEMGTNTPGEIGRLTEILAPRVGAITNIGPAHLEGLGGVDGVQREKGDLFKKLPAGAIAVVNEDDLRVKAVSDLFPGRKVSFGEERGDVRGKILAMTPDSMEIQLDYGEDRMDVTMASPGVQFFRNALCTSAISFALGIQKELVHDGLSSFLTGSGRFSILNPGRDVVVVDDTYNSNPLSVEVAIHNLKLMFPGRKIVFLLGDMLELGEAADSSHQRIGGLASSLGPHRIYTFGELASKIHEGALRAGYPQSQCGHFEDVEELAKTLLEDRIRGSVILVKGSRMMKLERVVDRIVESFPARGNEA